MKGITSQYSTYSDVRPNVGGGDYGAPSCPVWCESLNQWQDRLYRTQTQPSTPPTFLTANAACQTKLLTFRSKQAAKSSEDHYGNCEPKHEKIELLTTALQKLDRAHPQVHYSNTQVSFSHSQVMTKILAQFSQRWKIERVQLHMLPTV